MSRRDTIMQDIQINDLQCGYRGSLAFNYKDRKRAEETIKEIENRIRKKQVKVFKIK